MHVDGETTNGHSRLQCLQRTLIEMTRAEGSIR